MFFTQLRIGFLLSVGISSFISNAALFVPSTSLPSLGGGLTIISQNDLYYSPVSHSGAILLNEAMSFATASASCNLLGETLWVPGNGSFALNSSLSYQIYQGLFPHRQNFWIANTTSKACKATDFQGVFSNVDCHQELPALCSQSAPISNFTSLYTPTPYQITQMVGAQQLTGYRDFYTWKFMGVRYAAQPERFNYSTVFAGTGNNSALLPGATCSQYIGEVKLGSSEDCLSLNIWTPYLAPTSSHSQPKLKPVMFWIHGGGFTSGTASNPNTDGTNLASRGDVVVVSLNYRLGFFGFLAYPDGIHNGNYGFGDIITALQWVSRNIRAFGGDSNRVTIFGESAGAASVQALLASPETKGLFANAIMQSANSADKYISIQDYSNTYTNSALTSTGCDNATDHIACLRSVNASILANLHTSGQLLVLDGKFLQTSELALNNTSGHTSKIRVMVGDTRDEAGILVPYPPTGITISQWFAALSAAGFTVPSGILSPNGTTLFSIPDTPTTAQIYNITLRIGTDVEFTCALAAASYSAAKHNVFAQLYSFQFNRTYSPNGYTTSWCQPVSTATRPNGDPDLEYYKCHGGEQLYPFGNILLRNVDRDGKDVPFAQLIVDYWSAFAYNGDPNPKKSYLQARGYWNTLERAEVTGRWEQVADGTDAWRVLQWDGYMRKTFPEREQCTFLGLPLNYFEAS